MIAPTGSDGVNDPHRFVSPPWSRGALAAMYELSNKFRHVVKGGWPFVSRFLFLSKETFFGLSLSKCGLAGGSGISDMCFERRVNLLVDDPSARFNLSCAWTQSFSRDLEDIHMTISLQQSSQLLRGCCNLTHLQFSALAYLLEQNKYQSAALNK